MMLTEDERAQLRYSDGSPMSIREEPLEAIVESIVAAHESALVAEVRRLRTEIAGLADSGDRMHGKVRTSELRALLAVNGDSHTHAHTGGDEESV
jgi:plasmid stabilization system protein ParE